LAAIELGENLRIWGPFFQQSCSWPFFWCHLLAIFRPEKNKAAWKPIDKQRILIACSTKSPACIFFPHVCLIALSKMSPNSRDAQTHIGAVLVERLWIYYAAIDDTLVLK
jgi:hypothetical protein